MKKHTFLHFGIFTLFILLCACEEQGPFIDFSAPNILLDTTFVATTIPTAQDKIILIEEYSGVQCNNCPKGAEEVENIKAMYPNQIVSTTLHAGPFANALPNSTQDFPIDESVALNDFFAVSGYPAAVLDRYFFNSQNQIAVTIPEQWAGLVAERIASPTPVNLSIESNFDEITKEILATITAVFTETVTNENLIMSVFLTEDNIKDSQLMPDNSINDTYKHEHVLRAMFTNWGGLGLDFSAENTYIAGTTIIKTFSLPLADTWHFDNLNIIASIHKDGTSSKEVLQSAEIHLGE